jgi:lysine-N-methylase
MPDVTFEQMEAPAGPLPPEAEELLTRYYAIKTDSIQFCGPTFYGVGLWEGLEALALTYPCILWLRRAYSDVPVLEAVARAVSLVDDHFGFNRVVGSRRQRLSFRLLASTGELDKLIAWYSR